MDSILIRTPGVHRCYVVHVGGGDFLGQLSSFVAHESVAEIDGGVLRPRPLPRVGEAAAVGKDKVQVDRGVACGEDLCLSRVVVVVEYALAGSCRVVPERYTMLRSKCHALVLFSV